MPSAVTTTLLFLMASAHALVVPHISVLVQGGQRCAGLRMGGPSGLPRMPVRGWQYTKSYNPSGEYNERIATLYRDLEITLGTFDSPNEDLALRAVKRLPDIINPECASLSPCLVSLRAHPGAAGSRLCSAVRLHGGSSSALRICW